MFVQQYIIRSSVWPTSVQLPYCVFFICIFAQNHQLRSPDHNNACWSYCILSRAPIVKVNLCLTSTVRGGTNKFCNFELQHINNVTMIESGPFNFWISNFQTYLQFFNFKLSNIFTIIEGWSTKSDPDARPQWRANLRTRRNRAKFKIGRERERHQPVARSRSKERFQKSDSARCSTSGSGKPTLVYIAWKHPQVAGRAESRDGIK